MPSFAGVIYPNAFQISDLMVSIAQTFLSSPNSQPFNLFRYKSIEMGSWNLAPGHNKHKSIWAIVSGHFTNREELTQALKESGHAPESKEDVHLAILAYEAWGAEELFKKINGPFAIALFDERKEELFLSIDRMGQKALYWSLQGNHFLFGTELKALLASGIVPQNASYTAFSSYFYFGFIPQDYSAVESVNKLLPGHFLKVDLRRRMAVKQYWSLSEQLHQKEAYSLEEADHTLGALLEKCIKRAAPAHTPVATYVHDALGSDMLAWLLAHHSERDQIDTYTPLFEQKDSPTLQHAAAFTQELSVRHHAKQISVDAALDELPRIIWHLDEPVADPCILQTWNLGRLMQSSDSQLILALGWRELMAGHDYYFGKAPDFAIPVPLAHTLAQLNPVLRDRILFPILRLFHPRLAFRMLRNIRINRDQIAYLAYTALFKGDNRKKASPFLYRYFDPEVFTQRFHRLSHSLGDVHPSLYYDLKTMLPNLRLLQYDRLLDPFGVKTATPFLDNEMIRFAASLPDEVKFAHDEPGAVLLSLWRRLTKKEANYAPPPLMSPSWSNHKRLHTLFKLLEKGRLVEEGLVSPHWIRDMCKQKDLTDIAFRELWSVLVLEIWFRLFINRPLGMTDHSVTAESLLT